ncbi:MULTISPECIES: acireductone synthase [unclassified Sphingomonas]|uniref:acireductone synthase n=1 Tax=unclassified Sphingomonas TaxID=196159 RepID=UPI000835FD8B|nr:MULTISPECIES: acireductone synthase [unclassified Sphingomonas]
MPNAGPILLDIEGTTSSIAFVAETLFPYARARLRAFVAANAARCAPILAEVAAVAPGDPVATLIQWIDEDRKATPLKTLQGMIWAEGYADGSLSGHVYPDTPRALARWQAQGRRIFIYSSGSEEAQRLLFAHSLAGDLTPFLAGHFDTRIGAKRDAASYAAIARAIDAHPSDILFISDIAAEIDAARAAGLSALRIDREGGTDADIASLDEVLAT